MVESERMDHTVPQFCINFTFECVEVHLLKESGRYAFRICEYSDNNKPIDHHVVLNEQDFVSPDALSAKLPCGLNKLATRSDFSELARIFVTSINDRVAEISIPVM